jgi:hypothetical protein
MLSYEGDILPPGAIEQIPGALSFGPDKNSRCRVTHVLVTCDPVRTWILRPVLRPARA